MSVTSDLYTYVDETAGGVFWTASQVANALNEAQIRVWTDLRFDIGTSTFTATTGADIVAFDSATLMIPQFFLLSPDDPLSTGTGTATVKYFPTTMAKLEQFQRNWRVDGPQFPSQPKWFAQYDSFSFRVFPTPDKTYKFILWGVNYPTEITTSGTGTDITQPDLLKRLVVYRAAERLFAYTRPDLTAQALQNAESVQIYWRRQYRNRQGHRIYRLRPGIVRTLDTPSKAGAGVIRIGRNLF